MTKAELIKAVENYPNNIEIKICVNCIVYDLTEYTTFVDMDTNTKYIALKNKENEVEYRKRIENRMIN